MAVSTTALIGWLVSLGWDAQQEAGAPVVMGPYVPDEPDRIVVVTPTGGPGYVLEGAADAGTFQARVRGPQDDQPAAEALAGLLDSLILNASFPVVLAGGEVLVHVHRSGSGPSPLGPGPADGFRWTYVTTYLCISST
ncbi:MAG TPA: minor capsid protein [Streptosporangiaceae bacterium]|nr:minor capsid protein [Streptosporangiaceae bacterium]